MTIRLRRVAELYIISIHMPHTWHDFLCGQKLADEIISIHMPHTWHDWSRKAQNKEPVQFQSTCHIRGMTPQEQTQLLWC